MLSPLLRRAVVQLWEREQCHQCKSLAGGGGLNFHCGREKGRVIALACDIPAVLFFKKANLRRREIGSRKSEPFRGEIGDGEKNESLKEAKKEEEE